jgi:hypothetical protein
VLEYEEHINAMSMPYANEPGRYVDVTLLLISLIKDIFNLESLRELKGVKANPKI